jgi:hypothetical protein
MQASVTKIVDKVMGKSARSATAGSNSNNNGIDQKAVEVTYYLGSHFMDSPDGDLNKENIRKQLTTPIAVEIHDAIYKAAFETSVSVSSSGKAEKEALALMNYFSRGDGPNWNENHALEFDCDSGISKELGMESSFIQFAKEFEDEAKKYYQAHGNLNEFNGAQLLRQLRKKNDIYFDDNLYMLATMGGFAAMDAMIQINEWGHFTFKYTIWDHYGAGTSDMNSKLPGLPDMYHLQHVSPNLGEGYSARYKPFVWNIQIIRK